MALEYLIKEDETDVSENFSIDRLPSEDLYPSKRFLKEIEENPDYKFINKLTMSDFVKQVKLRFGSE